MNRLLIKTPFLLCILFAFSCSSKEEKQLPPSKKTNRADLSWLIGNWQRTNDSKNQITKERWVRTSNTELSGLGCTLQDGDTIFQEALRIYEDGDTRILEVSGENETPTLFSFTENVDFSFTCENPKNDFPSKIMYSFKKDSLFATISADEERISFVFKRVEPLR